MQNNSTKIALRQRPGPGLSAFRSLLEACMPLPAQPAPPGWQTVWADDGNLFPASCRPGQASERPMAGAAAPFYFEAPEFDRIEQLLDVGGGAGWMASLLKAYQPHMKITVFDLPPLCEKALELFRERGQNDDLGAHPGHYLRDPFPSGFEAIQYSALLHSLPRQQITILLRKGFEALMPGGTLLLQVQGPARRPDGRAGYSSAQYQQALRALGFSAVQCRQGPARQALIVARK